MTTGEAEIKQGEQTGEAQADLTATSGDAGQTSYTPEQIRNLLSDLQAAKGREAKAREELKSHQLNIEKSKAESEAQARQREIDSIESSDDLSDSEKKQLIKAVDLKKKYSQELRDLNAKIEEKRKEAEGLSEKLSKVELAEKEDKLKSLAVEKGIDLDTLKKASAKINDFNALEEIADLLPKVRKEAPKFDSGKGLSAGKPSINAMTMPELRAIRKKYPGREFTDLIKEGVLRP